MSEAESYLYYIGFSFALFSILVSTVTIFFQLWVPKLRKFPGILITMQCVGQLFYDFHWLPVLPQFNDWLKYRDPRLCEGWGIITMEFYFLGYNYATCLSLEILLKLRHRATLQFRRRLMIYHLCSWGISTFFCIIIYIFKGYGISGLNTCSVTNKDFVHNLEFAPFILNIPIIWYAAASAFMHNRKKYSSVTINFTLVVLSVSVTWFLPTFVKLIVMITQKNGDWTFIAFFIGTLSGTFVGFSRLCNRKVIKEIQKHARNSLRGANDKVSSSDKTDRLLMSSNSSLNLFNPDDIDFFTNFYDTLSGHDFLRILIVLAIKYKNEIHKNIQEKHKKNKIYTFSLEEFESFANYYGIQKINSLFSQNLCLKSYNTWEFSKILQSHDIEPLEIYQSLLNHENLRKIRNMLRISGGSSRAVVFSTADEKFVIKTILKAEKKIFTNELLTNYFKRLQLCPESKLVRILGIFKLQPTREYFILMENIIPFSSDALIFDLKGSSVGRLVELSDSFALSPGRVLKDENFKISGKKVVLGQAQCQELIEILKDDMKILMNLNIMDYSLLLGMYEHGHSIEETNKRYLVYQDDNELYAVGVIDIFQKYNTYKISERAIKTVLFKDSDGLSVLPSSSYFTRLSQFLKEIFIADI